MVNKMKSGTKLICGVGFNDADYAVNPVISGARVMCPFYQSWKHMIKRCYSKIEHQRRPRYADCSVCAEWLVFSRFKAWMITQDWEGKQLDKDILVVGNKVYSPETCAFVDSRTNSFVTERNSSRGIYPIGVHWHKRSNSFQANCNDPYTNSRIFLGSFKCQNQAHEAWRNRKHELACQLADLQTDQRVAEALRLRYAP